MNMFSVLHRRAPVLCVFLSVLLAQTLCAQRMVVADSKAQPVEVESAEVTTEVTGSIAVTTFDLVFRNPNARQLEGTFEFPLLDGQSVVRFALDIGGAMREAVPVEKEKGRVVFEEIERRQVDPGLLEQTAGNNYRARIFPIPAEGTRRILIAYQEDLKRGGARSDYRLALAFPNVLKRFKLGLMVFAAGAEQAKVNTTLPLVLPTWGEGKFIQVEKTDFKAAGLLEIVLPTLLEPAYLTGQREGLEYFLAELPLGGTLAARERPAPRVLGLLWDASGSGARRDHKRELALLDELFRGLGSVQVKLVLLRDKAEAVGSFSVVAGGWDKLRRALEEVDYDGASSLEGLADDAAVDEWLHFGDGLLNYGSTMTARALPLTKPVHCIASSVGANTGWLRRVAQAGRGEFADLLALETKAAVALLRTQSPRVLSVKGDRSAFAQVFPEPGAVVSGNMIRVAGQFRSEAATLRVRVGHDEADARELSVRILSGQNTSALAPRGWAVAKIQALSVEPEANREDIRRTSREFSVVTADTSLIVLETLADYERYGIRPPAELRAEWDSRRLVREERQGVEKRAHIETLVQRFRERVAWWEKEFPKDRPTPEPFKEEKVRQERSVPGGTHRRGDTAVASATLGSSRPQRPSPDQSSFGPGGAATPPPPDGVVSRTADGEEVVVLSPFMVESAEDRGYRASNTLAGTRMRTGVRDFGAAGGEGGSVGYGAASAASAAPARAASAARRANANSPEPGDGDDDAPGASSIALKPWSPKAGYIERLQRSPKGSWNDIYHEERVTQAGSPGFYLDVAEFLLSQGERDAALQVLSNLAELALEDAGLLRVLAHRLMQAGRADLALPLFERILAIRGEEPQSYRDLALACIETGARQRAIGLLWTVVSRPWNDRFPDIELIALAELNAVVATSSEKLDTSVVDPRLLRNLPLGLRVVLSWDADNCDIDLWVADPNAESVGYNHTASLQGGRISRDFTGGYGPEEFALRAPKDGRYTVRVNYFGDRRQNSFGPVTAQVLVYTDFGTPQQKLERLTLRLSEKAENADVGAVTIGK